MQAVILAGGLGTRLGAATRDCPKPMLPVGGRPFVEYLVEGLVAHGARDILFLLSYLPAVFQEHFGDGAGWDARIRYVVEPEPRGTAGALAHAHEELASEFVVLNGDTFLAADPRALRSAAMARGVDACVALRRQDDAGRFGSVRLQDGLITDFAEKSGPGRSGLINGGVYWCRRDIVAALPAGPCSLEREVFPRLAAAGRLGGWETTGHFLDIGIPATLAAAQQLVPAWHRSSESCR